MLQSLHKVRSSSTLYYQVCTKFAPVLLLYCRACTQHFPVLLLYCKACTKYFPVLLYTTKLAQSTSQACAKYFPSADISISQPWCSHSNAIYEVQLRKKIVLRAQPRRQATLTQPLECDLQTLTCKTEKNYTQRRQKLQLQNRISPPQRKKARFWNILDNFWKGILKGKITNAKMKNICWQITIAALMQPFQCDLRGPAAKDNSIAHAAAAPSNLDAAIALRSATRESTNA